MTANVIDAFVRFVANITAEQLAELYMNDEPSYVAEKLALCVRNPLGWWASLDAHNRLRAARIICAKHNALAAV